MGGREPQDWHEEDSQLDVKEDVKPDPEWHSSHGWELEEEEHRNESHKTHPVVKGEDQPEKQEYEQMEIPEHWLPLPMFLVRNIPVRRDIAEEEVKRMVESVRQLKVHSIHFDQAPTEKVMGRRTALVRLEPLPLPWQTTEEEVKEEANGGDGGREEDQTKGGPNEDAKEGPKRRRGNKKGSTPPKDGDTGTFATWAVHKLKMQNPPLQIGGETVTFENSTLQAQLYIGNLSPEWQEDVAFVTAMSQYGSLERAYVMRNAKGQSKGYGFVEFSLPSGAIACKRAMDEIERNMRPDPKKMARAPPKKVEKKEEEREDDGGSQEDGKSEKNREDERSRAAAFKLAGWPEGGPRLVKLLRAEWASIRTVESMFSKVLYVANLRTHQGSQKQLKELFEQFGEVQEVTVPKNKATNSTKGFAFVLYANGISADSAYRALEKSGSEEIGGALVSFANSAKQSDYQARSSTNVTPRLQAGPGRGTPAIRPLPLPVPGFPAGRGGRGPGPGPVPGRGAAPPAFAPDARAMPGRGRGFAEPTDPYRSQLQIQQDLQAQQMRMQQQMEQRLASQMQNQLRQAQLQLQQAQQQTQLLQRQALQAQQKAAAEAEARKRAEDEARRAAALASASKGPSMQSKRGPAGFTGMGEAMGGRGPQSGYVGYGSGGSGGGSGGLPAKFKSSQAGGYGPGGYGQASASAGFGASSQGYGSSSGGMGGFGQGGYDAPSSQGYGSAEGYSGGNGSGYGGSDYDGGGYGGQGGYGGSSGDAGGYGQGAYDQGGSYDQGYGGYGGDAGYEGGQAGYGNSEYGGGGYGGQGSGAGYGESSVYGQSGYGDYSQSHGSSGQKRSYPYSQGSYGGYGGASGGYGGQGDAGKRARY